MYWLSSTFRIALMGLFVSLLAARVSGQGWEWQNPLIIGNHLNSIGLLGDSTVWASSSAGDLLWSTDAGQTWALRNAANGPRSEVVFVDELHGWGIDGYVGYVGYSPDPTNLNVYCTSDGGCSWSVQHSLPHVDGAFLSDIEFVDSQNGWVVGLQLTFPDCCIQFHTDDGGLTWYQDGVMGCNVCPENVSFISAQEGWATTDWYGDPLWHTTDAGLTWTEVLASSPVRRVEFLDSMRGWGIGQDDVYRTNDGGLTWEPQGLDYSGWYSSSVLQCVNDSVVVAAGNNVRIFQTTNSGAS